MGRRYWKAHEVLRAIAEADQYHDCLDFANWLKRHQLDNPGEVERFTKAAEEHLLNLRKLGLPEEVIHSVVGWHKDVRI